MTAPDGSAESMQAWRVGAMAKLTGVTAGDPTRRRRLRDAPQPAADAG